MVTASPNLGTDSVRLWGKYFLAKNMAIQIPVLLTDLLVSAKMALGLQREFPLQMLCHLTNASFVLCAKPALKDRPDFIPWFISLDTAWQAFASNVFFNKNKLLTSDDINSWVGLWLGQHCLRQQAGLIGPFLSSPTFMSQLLNFEHSQKLSQAKFFWTKNFQNSC